MSRSRNVESEASGWEMEVGLQRCRELSLLVGRIHLNQSSETLMKTFKEEELLKRKLTLRPFTDQLNCPPLLSFHRTRFLQRPNDNQSLSVHSDSSIDLRSLERKSRRLD